MYGNDLSKALRSYKNNIKCIKDFSSDVEDDRFTLSAVNLDNDGITVKYESSRIYGDEPNLTLDFVNPDGYYYLQIRKIIVQYYDNSDGWMPKYDNTMKYGKNYADVIYYKDDDATDWTEATGTRTDKTQRRHCQDTHRQRNDHIHTPGITQTQPADSHHRPRQEDHRRNDRRDLLHHP